MTEIANALPEAPTPQHDIANAAPKRPPTRGGRRPQRPPEPPPLLPGPLFPKIKLDVSFTFATPLAAQAATTLLEPYERHISYLYHFVTARLRYATLEQRTASLVEVLDRAFTGTLAPDLLDERTANVQATLEAVGFDPAVIYQHTDVVAFQGTLESPHGRQFLDYLIAVDRYEGLRTVAWFQGLVDQKLHANEHWRYRHTIEKYFRAIERMAERARQRRYNPLVDSGDFYGRTRAEIAAQNARKAEAEAAKAARAAAASADTPTASEASAVAADTDGAAAPLPASDAAATAEHEDTPTAKRRATARRTAADDAAAEEAVA